MVIAPKGPTLNTPVDDKLVVVIGAGVMGRGIAYAAAVGGYQVVLVDERRAALTDATTQIQRDLAAARTRSIITETVAHDAQQRVATSTSISQALTTPWSSLATTPVSHDRADGGTADSLVGLVIEAVVEDLEVKHEVLGAVEPLVADDTIIATNTSALSVTEIMGCLADPARGVGMHFFNPVPKMPLVEIVRGSATSDETVTATSTHAHAMGKQTVVVADVAGFATSRLNALIGNEGLRMLEDGVASAADIDTAARLGLRHPMGPLEMGDLVGWDTRLAILEHLEATLGPRFQPTAFHRQLVADGRLGRKSGQGIYRYDEHGQRIDSPLRDDEPSSGHTR